MVVAELVTKFSFQGSLRPIDELNNKLEIGINEIARLTAAMGAAGLALNGWVASILAGADEMEQLSRATGVSVETIQELGYVASVNGSSVEALRDSLIELNKTIGEAAIEGNEEFEKLGISVRKANGEVKSADEILMELRDRFRELGLSIEEQMSYIDKLGMDKSMVQMLQLTNEQMEQLRQKARALGIVTEEQADLIASFNDSLTDLRFAMDGIQKQIAIAFAPQLKNLADEVVNFLVANKELIQNGLKKFFELINTGIGAVWNFGKILYKAIDGTIGFKNALIALGAYFVIFNKITKKNVIVAAILAIIAVVDDLNVALKGGKSVINEWLEAWFGYDLAQLIKFWKQQFMDFMDFVGRMGDEIGEFFKPLTDMLNEVEAFLVKWGRKLGLLHNPVANIKAQPITEIDKKIYADNPIVKVKHNLEDLDFKKAMFPHLYSTTNNNSNIKNTQNNNIKIEVRTEDAKEAGRVVAGEVEKVLDRANLYFSRKGGL